MSKQDKQDFTSIFMKHARPKLYALGEALVPSPKLLLTLIGMVGAIYTENYVPLAIASALVHLYMPDINWKGQKEDNNNDTQDFTL